MDDIFQIGERGQQHDLDVLRPGIQAVDRRHDLIAGGRQDAFLLCSCGDRILYQQNDGL